MKQRRSATTINLKNIVDMLQEPITHARRNSKANHERTESLPVITFDELYCSDDLDEAWLNNKSENFTYCYDPRKRSYSKGQEAVQTRIEIIDGIENCGVRDQQSIDLDNDRYVDIFSNDKNFHVYEDGWVELASEVEHASALRKVLHRSRNIARDIFRGVKKHE